MATHKATVKLANTYDFVNIRSNPSAAGVDIGNFNKGQEAQGTLVGADPATQWMALEFIDSVGVSEPSFIAAWLCDLTPIPQDPPTTSPNIRVDVTLYDDFTGLVETKVNDEVVSTWTGRLKPPVG